MKMDNFFLLNLNYLKLDFLKAVATIQNSAETWFKSSSVSESNYFWIWANLTPNKEWKENEKKTWIHDIVSDNLILSSGMV